MSQLGKPLHSQCATYVRLDHFHKQHIFKLTLSKYYISLVGKNVSSQMLFQIEPKKENRISMEHNLHHFILIFL